MDSLKNQTKAPSCPLLPVKRITVVGLVIAVAGLTLAVARFGHAEPPPDHRQYLSVIQQELARLDMNARCDTTTATCRYTTGVKVSERPLELVVRLSPETDTVYICFEQFLLFKADTAPTPTLALKLLGLNREMITGKFEWDEETRTIRLSTVLSTDSNFDRRAFRSQVKGLIEIARALAPKLQAVDAE